MEIFKALISLAGWVFGPAWVGYLSGRPFWVGAASGAALVVVGVIASEGAEDAKINGFTVIAPYLLAVVYAFSAGLL